MDILLKDTGDGGEVVLQESLRENTDNKQLILRASGMTGITKDLEGLPLRYIMESNGRPYYESELTVPYFVSFSGVEWQAYYFNGFSAFEWTNPSTADDPPQTGWSTSGAPFEIGPPTFSYEYSPTYTTANADIYPDTGIGTAVYTSLFTSANWSDLLKSEEEIVRGAGDFEAQLSEPITAGSVATLQQKALIQLSWLKSTGAVSELSVRVSNPAVAVIQVDIYTTEPNDAKNRYKMLWNKQEQKLISMKRNQL